MNLQDKLNELNVAGTFHTEETTQHQRIKILENELDKIIIKYNEAQSIKKTYEQIIVQIKQERVGFDNQIKIVKKTLQNKKKDLVDLNLLANKALHAKEVSLNEFKHFKKEQDKIKKRQADYIKQKEEDITQKFQNFDQRQSQQLRDGDDLLDTEKNRQNKSSLEDDIKKRQQEIIKYEQAFKLIKKQTGAVDINEIIQKYIVHEETKNSLNQLQQNYQQKIQKQYETQEQLKKEIEDLRENKGISDHKKQIESIDKQTSEANRRLQEQRIRCEKITDTLVQFQSGIEHLYNKLQFVDLEEQINYNEDESPLIKMIKNLNQKVKKVQDVVKKDPKASTVLNKDFTSDQNLIVFQNFVDPNLYTKHVFNDQQAMQFEKRQDEDQVSEEQITSNSEEDQSQEQIEIYDTNVQFFNLTIQ